MALGGEVTCSCEELETVAVRGVCDAKRTWALEGKLAPERVMEVPPATGPSAGMAAGTGESEGAGAESCEGEETSMIPMPRLPWPQTDWEAPASSIKVGTPCVA